MTRADADDTRRNLCSPVVNLQVGSVGDLLQLVQQDIEPVAHGVGTGSDHHVSSGQVRPLDAREAERDPLSGDGSFHALVVHLHGTDTYIKASWLDHELVAVADRAGPERAGCDRADAAQGEHAIDEQAGGEGAAASFVRVGG